MHKLCLFLLAFLGNLPFVHSQIKVDIGELPELHATDKLNVVLIPSDENYASIEGEFADKVEVSQQGRVLRIKMGPGYPLKGGHTFVHVYTNAVYSLTVQKGAIVQTEEGAIAADSILIWANEGGKVDLAVKAKRVEVSSTTGSAVTLRGEADTQAIILTFGGSYYGEKLLTNKAYARTNGGGVCEVRASMSADVQTRAGGVINVYGSPAEKKQKRLAGGKINFLDEK
ncbi:GIN domain-containing protein [Sphingobacterium griseoflavum]|uniref:Putative auto-transporter adhesin head GIN domain-containing protein n=1 Tax=Sphingobacterium griseoflavum TaxID=1474952 RepID=A0ABQ3HU05_9SPHI|nr:DUF2807 domain-containing protein [Sphingobacterium griseoflavum]GHE34685.1 hypothetical protein GCM10017764_17290 [Sphingobacterium griseoflavum]